MPTSDPLDPDIGSVDAYEFIDRAWRADELDRMIEDAKSILQRTGFVTHYKQHFLIQRSSTWFVYADPEERGVPVDRDAVEERYDDILFADPTKFGDLPEAITDAAGGGHGRLAWAMEVMKRSRRPARFERSAELDVTPVGRLGDAFRRGRPDEAAAHLSWLMAEIYRTGWDDGAYFEGVRVSDVIAQELKEATGAQQSSGRSQAKQRRRSACAKFIANIDPDGGLSAAALARLVHQAKAALDPIFDGIALLDMDDPENPRETAKEIAEIIKKAKRKAVTVELQADLSAAVKDLLASD